MGTLLAEILDDQPIAPVALAVLSGVSPLGTKVKISSDLHSGHRGRSLAVVKFGTGQFTAATADALCRIGNDNPLGLFHDYQGFVCSSGQKGRENRYPDNGCPAEFEELTAGKIVFQPRRTKEKSQYLMLILIPVHLSLFLLSCEIGREQTYGISLAGVGK